MTQIYLCELEESDFSDEYVSWHSSEHTAFYSGSNRIFTKDNLLEDYRGSPADKWRQIKKIRKGYQPRPPNVRNKKGVLVSREQRSEALAQYPDFGAPLCAG